MITSGLVVIIKVETCLQLVDHASVDVIIWILWNVLSLNVDMHRVSFCGVFDLE